MIAKMMVMEKYPFFNMRRHFCPKCGMRLERISYTKRIDPSSLEGQRHNFSASEFYTGGDVQYTWDEFRCPKCGKHMTVKEIRQAEKEYRDRKCENDQRG